MKLAATFRLKICEVYDAVNKYATELLGIVPKLFLHVFFPDNVDIFVGIKQQ